MTKGRMYTCFVHISLLTTLFLVLAVSVSSTERPVLTSSLGGRFACVGKDVNFTCDVTNTGRLTWFIGSDDNKILFSLAENSSSLSTSRLDSTGQFIASLTNYSHHQQFSFLGNLTSMLTLHVGPTVSDSPVIINCSDGINHSMPSILSFAEFPSSLLNISLIILYGRGEYTLNVQWLAPRYDGGVDIDNYILVLIHDDITLYQTTTTDTVEAITSLNYSTNYTISLIAKNCAGTNATKLTIREDGCVIPSTPVNGTIKDFTSTHEGAEIHFYCNEGYSLSSENLSQCLNSTWSLDPRDYHCILPIPSGSTSIHASSPSGTSFTRESVPTTSSPITPMTSISSTALTAIIAPVVVIAMIIGAIFIALILLRICLHRHKANLRRKPCQVEENWYGDHELLTTRPGNSASGAPISSAIFPVSISYNTVVNSATETEITPYTGPPTVASQHSETTGLPTTNGRATHTPLENTTKHQNVMNYAEVSFVDARPTLSPLDRPVHYAELHLPQPTLEHPSSTLPLPTPSDTSPDLPDKHFLDEQFNIDKVIQQLEELIPHWWAVGEAADVSPTVLQEIANHFNSNERECFVEVINQIFVPRHTTWVSIIGICERAGFVDVADALFDSYKKGELPVQIDEDEDSIQPTSSELAPPIPPRQYHEEDLEDMPPLLPPPLPLEDVPSKLQSYGQTCN